MSDPAHRLPENDPTSSAPHSLGGRPDWLVGSEEGAQDEQAREHEAARLSSDPELSEAAPYERPRLPGPGQPAPEPERSTGPARWAAAASSVPKLDVVEGERGVVAKNMENASLARLSPPNAPRRPIPPPAAAPVAAHSEEGDAEEDGFPDDTLETPRPLAARARPPIDEPFWVVWLDQLRANPRVAIMILAAVVLGLGAWIFWPRSEPGVSIHTLKREARQRDGQTVRVEGRVGEVFMVGGGHAFNLHQGRDTLVVFTRESAPQTRERISVVGAISTGFMDGMPRLAIFEQPGSRANR